MKSAHCPFIHFIQRNMLMIMIKFKEKHCLTTAGTFERVITKRSKDAITPAIERKKNLPLFFCDGKINLFVILAVPGI